MKFVLLCAALSFVVWAAPARAGELCIGPACVGTGEHRDRDREESREHRDRDRDVGREGREHHAPNEAQEHREHDRDEGR